MKNRIKLNSPVVKSRAELETLTREIAELTLARNKHQIELDQAITSIREKFEGTLAQYNKALEVKTELARAWAEGNPTEFAGLKSLDLTHAVIGWRVGNPTLKTLTGWTWDRVLEKLKLLGLASYVRMKEEVNKQGLVADRELLGPEQMRGFGVKVIQDESFYVEPKLTELENRQTAEAA